MTLRENIFFTLKYDGDIKIHMNKSDQQYNEASFKKTKNTKKINTERLEMYSCIEIVAKLHIKYI